MGGFSGSALFKGHQSSNRFNQGVKTGHATFRNKEGGGPRVFSPIQGVRPHHIKVVSPENIEQPNVTKEKISPISSKASKSSRQKEVSPNSSPQSQK